GDADVANVHSRTAPSSAPAARVAPSGEKASEPTLVDASRSRASPEPTSSTPAPLAPPHARRRLSGENASTGPSPAAMDRTRSVAGREHGAVLREAPRGHGGAVDPEDAPVADLDREDPHGVVRARDGER